MSNRQFSREELHAAAARVGLSGVTDISCYGSGHINDTFKVETAAGARFVLQHVNETIFDADVLRRNILRVTRFLKEKGVKSLEVVGYEGPWRAYAFLEGYASHDVVDDPRQAYDVARAFAQFQNDLADLPAPRLEEIIPMFHDTPDRLRQLDEAHAKDVAGRKADVAAEMAFVEKRREEAATVVRAMAAGEIPERVTHNDTKINNVLIAPDDTCVVIDLDTTMPGSALYDFGDMVRTSTAAAEEDERDLSKVASKREYFEALVRGYLAGAKFLNAREKELLVFSGKLATFEVGIRFLADYLNGDTYFHTAYPEHNLVRARNQFRMVESIEAQAEDYARIVREVAAHG